MKIPGLNVGVRPTPLSRPDAELALLLLSEWTPPAGLEYTVSYTRPRAESATRIVNVVLSTEAGGQIVVINITGVPDAKSFAALALAAEMIVAAAAAGATLSGPPEPPHGLYDTRGMGHG